MKPLNYTLYNKVKEKFPPQPFTVIFVSLKQDNLEELQGIAFTINEFDALCILGREHSKEALPYAVIGGFSQDDVTYEFYCREFEQEENLLTGHITRLSVGTYNNNPIDLETLRTDLQKLESGILLTGNA